MSSHALPTALLLFVVMLRQGMLTSFPCFYLSLVCHAMICDTNVVSYILFHAFCAEERRLCDFSAQSLLKCDVVPLFRICCMSPSPLQAISESEYFHLNVSLCFGTVICRKFYPIFYIKQFLRLYDATDIVLTCSCYNLQMSKEIMPLWLLRIKFSSLKYKPLV